MSAIFEHIDQVFAKQQAAYLRIGKSDCSQRLKWLKALEKSVIQHIPELTEAVGADMGKSKEEATLTEIYPLLAEIRHYKKNLRRWMYPRRVGASLLYLGTSSRIYYQSKGVCLIISPWNYSILLTLGPLVSALATGNTIILKPSEYTPKTASVIERMLADLFDQDHVQVFQGEVAVASHLLKLPFHHIFFTGSPRVGKIVVKAAAEHLASVTLELGGKSPTIVHHDAHVSKAAQRIAWGKGINAGQTCIAPDYILVHEDIKESLKKEIIKEWRKMYGEPTAYTSIIDQAHTDRLNEMGNTEYTRSYFPLQILDEEVSDEAMKDEIFGPVLPILSYREFDEAIRIIHQYTRPLVIYLFSNKKELAERVRQETRSGGLLINHTLIHFSQNDLPFGGVNHSGWGRYHGEEGFRAFSNPLGQVKQNWPFAITTLITPPYTSWKKRIIDFLVKYF